MEAVQHSLTSLDFAQISRKSRRALGLITFVLIRRLGSPERLMLARKAAPDIAAIMSPLNPKPLTDTTLPAFDARTMDREHMVTARFPGAYKLLLPITLDIAYRIQEPTFTSSRRNLCPLASVTEAALTCWPDHPSKMELPDTNELGGEFATKLAATALRRLYRSDLVSTVAWHIVDLE